MTLYLCKSCGQPLGQQTERELTLGLFVQNTSGETCFIGYATFFRHVVFRHRTADGRCGKTNHWQPVPQSQPVARMANLATQG
jgi:hypothetical protein